MPLQMLRVDYALSYLYHFFVYISADIQATAARQIHTIILGITNPPHHVYRTQSCAPRPDAV